MLSHYLFLLYALTFHLLHRTFVTALPVEDPYIVEVRQVRADEDDLKQSNETTSALEQVSNEIIARQFDDTDGELEDGTGPIRRAINAQVVYTLQPSPAWLAIDPKTADVDAVFTTYAVAKTAAPFAAAAQQFYSNQGFNVDHVFELQVIGSYARGPKPGAIAQANWESVTRAVFTAQPATTNIARVVTIPKNLRGIPSKVNGFKRLCQAFNPATGGGGPRPGPGSVYYTYFGPAVARYMQERRPDVVNVIGNIGLEFQRIANNDPTIYNDWMNFAQRRYADAIAFANSWGGRPRTSPPVDA